MSVDYMGLEVHDMGAGGYLLSGLSRNATHQEAQAAFHKMLNTPELTNPLILGVNSVITVEPGMYVPPPKLEETRLTQIKLFLHLRARRDISPRSGVREIYQ
jgi:hypothetical protein